MSLLITFIQNSPRSPIQSNQTRKMNWDYMKRLYQKLLELINKIGSLAEYNINIQKPAVFLYSNNYQEDKKQPVYNNIKKNKIFRKIFNQGKRSVHLTQYDTDEQTEECINKWKDIPFSWTRRINTVKMTMLSTQSRDLM